MLWVRAIGYVLVAALIAAGLILVGTVVYFEHARFVGINPFQ